MFHTTGHAVSADGTIIGYRSIGTGPALVICHGAGRISQNYLKLAADLADSYTVYIPDRRGRGLSGAAEGNYDITKATEDLSAIIKAVNAEFIFGHSAGGLIALETMFISPVKKLAVYEPPISVNKSLPADWLIDFEIALNKGQYKKAMAISLKGLKVHGGIVKMPFWSLMMLIHLLTFIEKKKEKGTKMIDLLSTIVPDMKMAMSLNSKSARYKNIKEPVSLMIGSNSPSYFFEGIEAAAKALPVSETKIFKNFDHYSPEEKTTEIAISLKAFFQN